MHEPVLHTTISLREGAPALLRPYGPGDRSLLLAYWDSLGADSRRRFGPHAFDPDGIDAFYADPRHRGFLVLDPTERMVMAYAVIRLGFLPQETERLRGYGMRLHETTDASYAPSVADAWQGQGIAQQVLDRLLPYLRAMAIQRILLWGGVQSDNMPALAFYRKNGFVEVGSFAHQGWNHDMQKWIR